MYSHSVPLSNSVVTGCKPKVVGCLRVQTSDRFRRTRTLCFVIALIHETVRARPWLFWGTVDKHTYIHIYIQIRPVGAMILRPTRGRDGLTRYLTRAPLGGGGLFRAPSRFLAISSKPMQVSPPNLQYPLSQQFYTLC